MRLRICDHTYLYSPGPLLIPALLLNGLTLPWLNKVTYLLTFITGNLGWLYYIHVLLGELLIVGFFDHLFQSILFEMVDKEIILVLTRARIPDSLYSVFLFSESAKKAIAQLSFGQV